MDFFAGSLRSENEKPDQKDSLPQYNCVLYIQYVPKSTKLITIVREQSKEHSTHSIGTYSNMYYVTTLCKLLEGFFIFLQ